MNGATDTLSGSRFSRYRFIEGPVPECDADSEIRCRRMCEENRCGQYGRTWACPPGFSVTLDDLRGRFSSAVLMVRAEEASPDDADATDELARSVQDDVRMAVAAISGTGRDCMGFADGACGYCGVCAYPEPCRFPAMLVPSISALGLDLGAYLGALGEKLEFRSDRVTLYGLLLLGRSASVGSERMPRRALFSNNIKADIKD